MTQTFQERQSTIRWPRVMALAAAISVVSIGLAWHHLQVEQDAQALGLLLTEARQLALNQSTGPVTVRFTNYDARLEGPDGTVLESLFLPTLSEVRYQTTRGDRMIVFTHRGITSPYNTNPHGGDVTLRAWTGHSQKVSVNGVGGIFKGQNARGTVDSD